jgi:hypothetical protein
VREVTVTAADGTTSVLTARHAVAVSTGSAALLPDIPGLADVSLDQPGDLCPASRRPPASSAGQLP